MISKSRHNVFYLIIITVFWLTKLFSLQYNPIKCLSWILRNYVQWIRTCFPCLIGFTKCVYVITNILTTQLKFRGQYIYIFNCLANYSLYNNFKTSVTENRLVIARGKGVGGLGKIGEGDQVQTCSYEINKSYLGVMYSMGNSDNNIVLTLHSNEW